MASDKYELLTDLEMNDTVRVTFPADDHYKVEDIVFPNPWETSVSFITEDTKDPREGDDVKHIEFHRTIGLAKPADAKSQDRIQLSTQMKMEEGSSTSSVYKKHHQSEDGNFYTLHPFGYESIERIDKAPHSRQ